MCWKNICEKKNCEGAKRPSLKRKIRAGGRGKMCWTAICEGVKQSSSKQNPGGGGVGGKGGAKCVGRTVVKERSDGVQIKYKVLGGGGNALEGYLHNIWTKFNVLEGYLQGSKATKFWRIGA